MQLLPEVVLVITALVLLAVAVGVEAKRGQSMSTGIAIPIAAGGVILAALALVRVPVAEPVTSLIVMDPLTATRIP